MRAAIQEPLSLSPPDTSWDLNDIDCVEDLCDILPDSRIVIVRRGGSEGERKILTIYPRFVQQLGKLLATTP
jgi:hypothetical protein